jgi:hypothetical protein
MKKTVLIIAGFLCFIFGATALVLSLVGVKLSFLLWLDYGGALLGFVLRLVMMFGGIILAWASLRNKEADVEENDPYITRIEKY